MTTAITRRKKSVNQLAKSLDVVLVDNGISTVANNNRKDHEYYWYPRADVLSWVVDQMPGLCGAAVICEFNKADYRRVHDKKYWQLFSEAMKRDAALEGYTVAYASDITGSIICDILEDQGWTIVKEFKNRRTGNKCRVYMADLPRVRRASY